MRRGYARAEERNAAVRAQLEPLAPGERPPALVAAALVAAALGTANLVAFLAGVDVEGEQPSAVGVLAFCAVMFVAAVVKAGARRIVVVRAIAHADDPEAAARALRAATNGGRRG